MYGMGIYQYISYGHILISIYMVWAYIDIDTYGHSSISIYMCIYIVWAYINTYYMGIPGFGVMAYWLIRVPAEVPPGSITLTVTLTALY